MQIKEDIGVKEMDPLRAAQRMVKFSEQDTTDAGKWS